MGAAMNLLAAVARDGGGGGGGSRGQEGEKRGREGCARELAGERGVVMLVFFLSGFAALGYEVLWTRFLSLLVVSTVHTYTIALSVVLTGIVAGSFFAARFFDRIGNPGFIFGALQVLSAVSVVLVMGLPSRVWQVLGGGPWVYFVLLLPPALFAGAAFPLAVRLWAGGAARGEPGGGPAFRGEHGGGNFRSARDGVRGLAAGGDAGSHVADLGGERGRGAPRLVEARRSSERGARGSGGGGGALAVARSSAGPGNADPGEPPGRGRRDRGSAGRGRGDTGGRS